MPGVMEMKELYLTTKNEPGTLAKVTAPIAEAGININAFCAWVEGKKAMFRIITNNTEKSQDVLKKAGYNVEEKTVVVLETTNEVGSMFKAAQNLAQDNVDLDYTYATNGPNGNKTWIVFGTKEIGKALNAVS